MNGCGRQVDGIMYCGVPVPYKRASRQKHLQKRTLGFSLAFRADRPTTTAQTRGRLPSDYQCCSRARGLLLAPEAEEVVVRELHRPLLTVSSTLHQDQ